MIPMLVLAAVIILALVPFYRGTEFRARHQQCRFPAFCRLLYATGRYVPSERAKYNIIVTVITALLVFVVLRFYQHIRACRLDGGVCLSVLAVPAATKKNACRRILDADHPGRLHGGPGASVYGQDGIIMRPSSFCFWYSCSCRGYSYHQLRTAQKNPAFH
jgi:hypothetical protein